MGKSAGVFCGKGKDINGIVAELGCVVKGGYGALLIFVCCFMKIETITEFLNINENEEKGEML